MTTRNTLPVAVTLMVCSLLALAAFLYLDRARSSPPAPATVASVNPPPAASVILDTSHLAQRTDVAANRQLMELVERETRRNASDLVLIKEKVRRDVTALQQKTEALAAKIPTRQHIAFETIHQLYVKALSSLIAGERGDRALAQLQLMLLAAESLPPALQESVAAAVRRDSAALEEFIGHRSQRITVLRTLIADVHATMPAEPQRQSETSDSDVSGIQTLLSQIKQWFTLEEIETDDPVALSISSERAQIAILKLRLTLALVDVSHSPASGTAISPQQWHDLHRTIQSLSVVHPAATARWARLTEQLRTADGIEMPALSHIRSLLTSDRVAQPPPSGEGA